ncbi:serine hydrolase domain-containing protein [Paenibacillus sp. CAA11]|uniref:serine hydrolase domain-containing protein n=1 Tax=Paenibacillus sp. CAA11 TaxID=1532905 RepID=UPI00131F12C0|nr:serine hydrolase domain-containing protein [Paenibacillus sp. CAA11]
MRKLLYGLLSALSCCLVFTAIYPAAARAASIPPASSQQSLTSHLEEIINPIMQEEIDRRHVPGAAVVITQGDQIIFSKGYGYADLKRKTPVSPGKTIMRIGSLTKTVTATAAMQLVEQGKLTLHDDVNTFLKDYKVPSYGKNPITLHHLLTHTAGLDESIYQIHALSPEHSIPASQYLRQFFDQQPPIREPGKEYAYSNAGLGLVGNLIEQRTGMELSEYMKQHLFNPLNMPSARLVVPKDNPDMAKSYAYSDGQYTEIPYSYLNIPGAGGISVIPEELAHFMISQINQGSYQGKSILQPSTVDTMQKQQFVEQPQMNGLGYGWYRNKLADGVALSHTGNVDGFSAKMELIPSHKLGILVISNAETSGKQGYDKVTDGVIQLFGDKPEAVKPIQLSQAQLQIYERKYTFAASPKQGWGKWLYFLGGRNFDVKAAAGKLILKGVFPDGTGETQEKNYLPIAEGLFQEESGGEKLWFHKEGGSWQMTLDQEITMNEEPGFWHRPSTLLVLFAGPGLLFVALLLIGLFRYIFRLFRKAKKPISWHIAAISMLMSVFLVIQLMYGISEITYGYPLWYVWGVSLLPVVASIIAVHLLWKIGRRPTGGKLAVMGKCSIAVICLVYTGYLYYWNMLSIHYS